MTTIRTYSLKTAPTTEPISLTEAKLHLKLDSDLTEDDDLVRQLIAAARRKVEDYTGRALVTQTWYGHADELSGEVQLYKCPVQSVTAITYIDDNGTRQTWTSSEYDTDLNRAPARIAEADGYSYPTAQPGINKYRIEFVAGYGASGDVPAELKQAILLLIGHWYEHRMSVVMASSSELPLTVHYLLDNYIVWR